MNLLDGLSLLSSPAFAGLELAGRIALATAMAIFIGLAFEDIYKHDVHDVPGGIRTFPLLALGGMALYMADPVNPLPYVGGVVALALWLYAYIRGKLVASVNPSLMIPATNLLAFALGPLALREAAWVTVAVAVAAVLLLGQREHLHRLVKTVPQEELTTAGKFLILAGVVFPLVPHEPIASWMPLTPYKMWLAVLAVSTLSYLSYLLQRYLPHRGDTLLPAVLGGSYSSTLTTVVLARRQKEFGTYNAEVSAGIVAATTTMYFRIAIVLYLFNSSLAAVLLPYLLASVIVGAALAAREWTKVAQDHVLKSTLNSAANPLGLGSAAIFVVLLVVISSLAAWIDHSYGAIGIMGLAIVAGAADIDPFLLNLVQGGAPTLSLTAISAAILLAVASNNLLKAIYARTIGGRGCRRATAILAILALINFAGVGLLLAHL